MAKGKYLKKKKKQSVHRMLRVLLLLLRPPPHPYYRLVAMPALCHSGPTPCTLHAYSMHAPCTLHARFVHAPCILVHAMLYLCCHVVFVNSAPDQVMLFLQEQTPRFCDVAGEVRLLLQKRHGLIGNTVAMLYLCHLSISSNIFKIFPDNISKSIFFERAILN